MMKKILGFLLVVSLFFLMTACSSDSHEVNEQDNEKQSNGEEISGEITVMGWGGGEELQPEKMPLKFSKKCILTLKLMKYGFPLIALMKSLMLRLLQEMQLMLLCYHLTGKLFVQNGLKI